MKKEMLTATKTDPYVGKRVLLFEGRGFVVYARIQEAQGPVVVTFNGRGDTRPNREGQGESFFEKYNISAIHCISTDNHWWQSEDFEEGLRTIKAFMDERGLKEVVTYGSSMGGYGALSASGVLEAKRVIAITPQYTVDPDVVPWDRRFIKDARKLSFVHDDLANHMAQNADILVISDPYFEIDQRHVEMIKAYRELHQLRVPFAEHDVAPVMVDCGILSQTILSAVAGTVDYKAFYRHLQRARRTNWCVLGGVSRLLHSRGRLKSALHFGAKAYNIAVVQGRVGSRVKVADRMIEGYAALLADANLPKLGLKVLESWVKFRDLRPNWLLMSKARLLEMDGQNDKAVKVYNEILAAYPTDRHALTGVCKLISTPRRVKTFYKAHSETCLKYPTCAKALLTKLSQLEMKPLFDDYVALVLAAHPLEAPKIKAAFQL